MTMSVGELKATEVLKSPTLKPNSPERSAAAFPYFCNDNSNKMLKRFLN